MSEVSAREVGVTVDTVVVPRGVDERGTALCLRSDYGLEAEARGEGRWRRNAATLALRVGFAECLAVVFQRLLTQVLLALVSNVLVLGD